MAAGGDSISCDHVKATGGNQKSIENNDALAVEAKSKLDQEALSFGDSH